MASLGWGGVRHAWENETVAPREWVGKTSPKERPPAVRPRGEGMRGALLAYWPPNKYTWKPMWLKLEPVVSQLVALPPAAKSVFVIARPCAAEMLKLSTRKTSASSSPWIVRDVLLSLMGGGPGSTSTSWLL